MARILNLFDTNYRYLVQFIKHCMEFIRKLFSKAKDCFSKETADPEMEDVADPDSVWTHLDNDEKDTFDPWSLPKPWSVDYIQPKIEVFRKSFDPMLITWDTTPDKAIESLKSAKYLDTNRIIFVVHGFENSIDTDWMLKIKDELIKQCDQTVALVGWGRGAHLLPIRYKQSAANTESVGIWLSAYAMQINHKITGIEIWGIGHSLGAHVVGIAGRYSYCFNRIAGLKLLILVFVLNIFASTVRSGSGRSCLREETGL